MARILCVWEMGAALGHLTNLKLFIDEALKQGHDISLAVRELQNVTTVFDLQDIRLFQSPSIRIPRLKYATPMMSFSHLILRQVFSNEQELKALVNSWQSIYDAVNPDLVIYDHAPSALIASMGRQWKKWIIGSGFLVPRDDGPFLGVFPGVRKTPENDRHLMSAESELLSLMNRVLLEQGLPVSDSVKSIYRQADKRLLLTLPELDHFGTRKDGDYIGIKWGSSDNKPHWLDGAEKKKSQKKAFAYLSFFEALPKLLDELILNDVNVLIYSRNMPPKFIEDYKDRVAFTDQPVDLNAAYQQADFMISHGNHGSAAQAYLLGLPQLLLPKHQEQMFLSQRFEQLGAGVISRRDQSGFASTVQQLMAMPRRPMNSNQDGVSGVESSLFSAIENLFRKEFGQSLP